MDRYAASTADLCTHCPYALAVPAREARAKKTLESAELCMVLG